MPRFFYPPYIACQKKKGKKISSHWDHRVEKCAAFLVAVAVVAAAAGEVAAVAAAVAVVAVAVVELAALEEAQFHNLVVQHRPVVPSVQAVPCIAAAVVVDVLAAEASAGAGATVTADAVVAAAAVVVVSLNQVGTGQRIKKRHEIY